MKPLLEDIRHTPLLWLLVFVPVVLLAQLLKPEAHTFLFLLSVIAFGGHARSRHGSRRRQDRRPDRRPAQCDAGQFD